MLYSYSELMNLHVREDMDIYKKINEYVNGAIVLPFDADILSYLNKNIIRLGGLLRPLKIYLIGGI